MRTVRPPGLPGALRLVEIDGREPAVVFLTGMGLSSAPTFLASVPARLVGDRRLIFLDPFGCGFSDAPEEFGYTLAEQADAVAEVLDRVTGGPGDVVGFSMGASIAVVLADSHPRLVRGLVAAEANLDQGGGSLSPAIAARTEQDLARDPAEVLASLLPDTGGDDQGRAALRAFLSRAAPHALHRSARALVEPLHPDVRQRLERLVIPKIDIAGSAPGSEYPGGRGPLTGTPVLRVAHAGHLLMWDDPAGWAGALDTALTHLDAPDRSTASPT